MSPWFGLNADSQTGQALTGVKITSGAAPTRASVIGWTSDVEDALGGAVGAHPIWSGHAAPKQCWLAPAAIAGCRTSPRQANATSVSAKTAVMRTALGTRPVALIGTLP